MEILLSLVMALLLSQRLMIQPHFGLILLPTAAAAHHRIKTFRSMGYLKSYLSIDASNSRDSNHEYRLVGNFNRCCFQSRMNLVQRKKTANFTRRHLIIYITTVCCVVVGIMVPDQPPPQLGYFANTAATRSTTQKMHPTGAGCLDPSFSIFLSIASSSNYPPVRVLPHVTHLI